MIPYGRQAVDDDDIAAVVQAMKGDWLTQGPHVEEFEQALVAATGAGHAIAFSSGTAALHAAAAVAGLGPGDVVATSPLSFVASANCALFVGARATFVDIDPNTLNLDPERVPVALDGLVAVHYAGLPVDLSALAHRPRVVIEDAAHALGATTPDGPVGNCAHADLCTFSFHPVKAVTTGEGGAVTTNSGALANGLRAFRSHGVVRQPNAGGWSYDIAALGFNYRLSDIQAALGTSQLTKLDRFIVRRNELAGRYRELLAGLPIVLPPAAPAGWRHAYHLFPVRVEDRRRVYDAMLAAGVGVQVHYVPIPALSLHGGSVAEWPAAEAACATLLSLPLFPTLSTDEQDRVVGALADAL